MEFLDPRNKKRRNIRLMIGYTLVAVMIVTSSVILVFQAYGFGVNRQTGEVIQNGLVFVDSAPDNAAIFINGKAQKDRTNTRLALPEGSYELVIKKDGYRDWKRTFRLAGGSIERFTHPLLIQNDLEQKEIGNYGMGEPAFSSESPDRRWLLVSKGASYTEFFDYDLNNVNKLSEKPVERSISFPVDLFAVAEGQHSLELIEWSTDNKHVLVKHVFAGGSEYMVLNRDLPTASINVTELLGVNPDKLVLRDKKFDQWYLYTAAGGILQTADAQKQIVTVLENVLSFKTHDANTILYTLANQDPTKQTAYIKQGRASHPIREMGAGVTQLDIARYDSDWYAIIASDADQRTYIYKDAFEYIERNGGMKPAPVTILRSEGAISWASFSQNTRFMLAQSGQHFEVYDAEEKETYKFNVSDTFDVATKIVWMDGHRLLARSNGQIILFDFDGSNKQTLVPASSSAPAFFDRDYTVLYSLNKSQVIPGTSGLISTSLRYEQDK